MPNRTDLLNHLATKYDLKRYLEIGVQVPALNFDKIKCEYKVGVDPDPKAMATFCMNSDEFFRLDAGEFSNIEITSAGDGAIKTIDKRFDLIFIDGLHTAEQVQKDFNNAMEIISDNGFVVLHDTNPASEDLTHWPRDKKGSWNGSVFGFAAKLKFFHYDPLTVDVDHGVTIVRGDSKDLRPIETTTTVPWEVFEFQRKELLNLISWNEFIQL